MSNRPRKKKKRQRNLILDWLAYAAFRVLLFIIYCFPIDTNLRTARFLGRLMWKHYHRGRDRAIVNLRASFPEKDDEWIEKTGRRSFEQIVMFVMDTIFTPRLVRKDNWRNFSTYINCERAKWMIKRGGVLMLTAHYGNFEIIGYMLSLFDFDIYSIARPLDNRFINDYLYGIRQRVGQKIIDKKGASTMMEQLARDKSTLCFIADQDAGKKGVFVDFFGRKASTYKSIGLLALQYNMPIGIAGCRRVGDKFQFEVEVQRIITPDEWQDKDQPLQWITQEYVKATEDLIRKDPTQYWWLHRRWKHRPKEERQKKIGRS